MMLPAYRAFTKNDALSEKCKRKNKQAHKYQGFVSILCL